MYLFVCPSWGGVYLLYMQNNTLTAIFFKNVGLLETENIISEYEKNVVPDVKLRDSFQKIPSDDLYMSRQCELVVYVQIN